jgi:hypothetical protein
MAMRKCTWVNTVGSRKSSMVNVDKASAFMCDKCRFYTTDMKMSLDWKHRIRAINDELPQDLPLTTFMSQRTIDYFEK